MSASHPSRPFWKPPQSPQTDDLSSAAIQCRSASAPAPSGGVFDDPITAHPAHAEPPGNLGWRHALAPQPMNVVSLPARGRRPPLVAPLSLGLRNALALAFE